MSIGKLLAEEPFLLKLFSSNGRTFRSYILKCEDSQLKRLIEIILNARQFALSKQEQQKLKAKETRKLLKYFEKWPARQLDRQEVKQILIKYRHALKPLGLQMLEKVVAEVCLGVVNQ